MNTGQSFGEATLARFLAPPPPGHAHFLTVNQAALHRVNVPRELHWRGQGTDILSGGPIDWSAGASPVLLSAPSSRDFSRYLGVAWARFCELWRFANGLTVLTSALPHDVLAAALKLRLRATLPERLDVVLRWHDNRVMGTLFRVLDARQIATLTAPASHWLWADREGNACELDSADALGGEPVPLPFELTQDQEDRLLAAGEVDAMIDLLIRQDAQGLAGLAPPAQHRLVHALLASSASFGIATVGDQVAYCHLGLQLGDGFHRESPWAEMLQDLKTSGASLQDVLAANLNEEA